MLYLRAVVLSRDERNVLRGLGDLGVVHTTKSEAGPETAPIDPPDNAAEMARCDALVERVDALLEAFNQPFDATSDQDEANVPSPEPIALFEAERRVAAIEQALDSLTRRTAEAETRCTTVRTVVEQLSSFKQVNLPFSELGNFSFLHFAIGSMPSAKIDELRDELADNVVLLPLPRNESDSALVAVTSRTGRFAMETVLKKEGFKKETVVLDEGKTLNDLIAKSQEEAEAADRMLSDLALAKRGLAADHAGELRKMRASVIAEKSVLGAEEQFAHTAQTTLVTGWVPKPDAARVTDRLQEITEGRCAVETLAPEQVPDVKVPVLMRHSWFLRPFEMLVSGYGTPSYQDLEPTLFVAITYMLMFGMMFGDAGHGLVLLLAGLGIVFSSKRDKTRDVGTLVSLAGAASIIFGLIYGSFFGLESFQKYALWPGHKSLDHLVQTEPMAIITLAIATGIAVISIGVILNIVNRVRKRDWRGGLFGGFGIIGALFYWGVIGLILKFAAIRSHGLVLAAIGLFIVLPLVVWILYLPISQAIRNRRQRKAEGAHGEEEGLGMSIVESAIEAFETVLSYMSNTVSFIRIAAYAMSHAAILMATFVLADKVVGANAGGGVPRLIVIIIGNLIAIILEGIIAAVQAMRLEYYEFFSKFFSGGGEEFKPFKLR
jgi:V/A-type H+-transporting ATPase subunit I